MDPKAIRKEVKSILQRIRKSGDSGGGKAFSDDDGGAKTTRPSTYLPPDAARGALGRRLAQLITSNQLLADQNDDDDTTEDQQEILVTVLKSCDWNPVILTSFLEELIIVTPRTADIEKSKESTRRSNTAVHHLLTQAILYANENCGGADEIRRTRVMNLLFRFYIKNHHKTIIEETTLDKSPDRFISDTPSHLRLFSKLKATSDRGAFCREMIQQAFFTIASRNDAAQALLQTSLSPVVSTVVLVRQEDTKTFELTSLMVHQLLFHASKFLQQTPLQTQQKVPRQQQEQAKTAVLQWLIRSLPLFLQSIPLSSSSSSLLMDLAHLWLQQILCNAEVMPSSSRSRSSMFCFIAKKILPFFTASSFSVNLSDLSNSMCILLTDSFPVIDDDIMRNEGSHQHDLDEVDWLGSVLSLAVCALSVPVLEDALALVTLLCNQMNAMVLEDHGVKATAGNEQFMIAQQSVALICQVVIVLFELRRRPEDDGNRAWILATENSLRLVSSISPSRMRFHQHILVRRLLFAADYVPIASNQINDKNGSLQLATDCLNNFNEKNEASKNLLPTEQNSLLLVGCVCIATTKTDAPQTGDEHPYGTRYILTLLKVLPHLSVTILPLLMQEIRKAVDDADSLIDRLEFMIEATAHEPHCAQEVWRLIGNEWIGNYHDTPLELRVVGLRLLPKLCSCNKRLYRRTIEILGILLSNPDYGVRRNVELKIAIAATLCDLARDDLIRDVSDVVGWVQDFIQHERDLPLVQSLAVETLHHLIVSQELDFDVVIKVLNKKLPCPVIAGSADYNVDTLFGLHPLLLESIVLLLGDGEIEVDSEDESEDESDDGVSLQVSRAVETLIALSFHDVIKKHPRIQHNIFSALSRYSNAALGLETDAVVPATIHVDAERKPSNETIRYTKLRDVVAAGLLDTYSGTVTPPKPLTNLARQILSLEEDALGSSLWQKKKITAANSDQDERKLSRKGERSKKKLIKSLLDMAPSVESIQEAYRDDPSVATSIAALLAFDGSNPDILVDYAGDLSNARLDSIRQVLAFQAWLIASSRLTETTCSSTTDSTTSLAERIQTVIADIRKWKELLDKEDYMLMMLACLAVALPDSAADEESGDPSLSSALNDLFDDVESAFKHHRFQSQDSAFIAFATITCRELVSGSSTRFKSFLEICEGRSRSSDYPFGMLYGLVLISRTLTMPDIAVAFNQSSSTLIGRCVAIIVEALQKEVALQGNILIEFVTCLRSGKASPDLVDSFSATVDDDVGILNSSAAGDAIMCLGLCCSSMASVNNNILLAFCYFLRRMSSCQANISLANAIQTCQMLKILKDDEVDGMMQERLSGGDTNPIGRLYLLCLLLPESEQTEDAMIELSKRASRPTVELLFVIMSTLGTLPTFGIRSNNPFSVPLIDPRTPKVGRWIQQFLSSDSDASVIFRGLFASLICRENLDWRLSKLVNFGDGRTHDGSHETTENDRSDASFAQLPLAQEQTLLWSVMESLRKGDAPGILLRWLEPLSLPSKQFHKSMKGMLLGPSNDKLDESTRASCMLLLRSQTSGRRKAVFDGSSFVDLILELSSQPLETLRSRLGMEGSRIFSSGAKNFVMKTSTANVEQILKSTFGLTMLDFTADISAISGWLSSILEVLKIADGSSISPKTLSTVRRFLIQDVFKTIQDASLINDGELLDRYIDCLMEIPSEFLQREAPTFSGSAFGMHCVLSLVCRGYYKEEAFGRISTSVSWLSRQTDSDPATIWGPLFRTSTAVVALSQHEQKQQILHLILDTMLLDGNNNSHHVDNNTSLLVLLAAVASRLSQTLTAFSSSSSLPSSLFNATVHLFDYETNRDLFEGVLSCLAMNLQANARTVHQKSIIRRSAGRGSNNEVMLITNQILRILQKGAGRKPLDEAKMTLVDTLVPVLLSLHQAGDSMENTVWIERLIWKNEA